MKILLLSNALTAALVSLVFTATIAWEYHTGQIVSADQYLATVDQELGGKKR